MRNIGTSLMTTPEIAALLGVRQVLLSRIRRRDERGDIPMGWVLVVAITITIVLAVGGILLTKLRTKANGLDLTTP